MKRVFALLLLSAIASLAQSPFDGTWTIDSNTTQLPQKPAEYLLAKGSFRWANTEIKADGIDQKVPETGYWDTISVRVLDDHTVEVISKKAGKIMFTEVDTVSPDGATLTQGVKDTTEAQAVTIETHSRRVAPGPAGSHVISGSWRAYKISRSETVPSLNSGAQRMVSVRRLHLASGSTQDSTAKIIPLKMTLLTQWSR
jgi:hypothetical protein